MSQQRHCCCGEEQEFGHECLATDKIFPVGTNLNRYPAKGQGKHEQFAKSGVGSFVSDGQQKFYNSRGTIQIEPFKRSMLPTRFQSPENDFAFNNLKTRELQNTTGMGCMLQHGTLIMSTKLLNSRVREFGRSSVRCNQPGCGASDYHFGSISRSTFSPQESEQFVMYNAYKDYWYLELGPRGFPYSFRSHRRPFYNAFQANGKFYDLNGLGVRSSGSDEPTIFGCAFFPQHTPHMTDADLMCHPELTNMTNPANVYFTREVKTAGGGASILPISDNTNQIKNSIEIAYSTVLPGVDNNQPELANHISNDGGNVSGPPTGQWLCTYMESNVNPYAQQFRAPCGGNFMPGVSSWQAYICRSQAEYRLLGDTMSFGNGAPIFTSPSSMIDLKQNQSNIAFAPLQNAMLGTLHRVRLWVRSDQVTIKDRFPCEDANGEHHSHYPPETNRKMRAPGPTTNNPNGYGYPILKKLCGSGPASLMYACSGVPIFTSDYEMMRERGTDADDSADSTGLLDIFEKLYYGDWDRDAPGAPYGGITDEKSAKCVFNVGQLEDSLGETGLYAAKDWRQDQLNKWDTMADKFKTIALQNVTNENLTNSQREALE